MTSIDTMKPPIPAATAKAKVAKKPVGALPKKQTDTFSPKNNIVQKTPPKKPSPLGIEKQWFINGAAVTGGLSFIISSSWLWSTIGTKRFSSWEGLHANIPMATVGGMAAGGAFGVLLCRFINSIKIRLNGTDTPPKEEPEALLALSAKQP